MASEFSFKKHLRAEASRDLIKEHFDAEVKVLTIVKDTTMKRADLEREFAKKLKALSAKAETQIKAAKPSSPSGIYDACAAVVTHLEAEVTLLEKRAASLSTKATVDLGNLITSKTTVKDDYYRERDRVDKSVNVTKTNANTSKKQYDEAAKKVAHYEKKSALAKTKSVRNVGKAAAKLDESVKDAVCAHNEYVGSLAANNEHIRRYNDVLLPHVLETLGELEQFLVADVKNVLKKIANAIDLRSDDNLDYMADVDILQEKVDDLTGSKEYVPLCLAGDEFTELAKPLNFTFNDLLSQQANNLELLESPKVVVTDNIKEQEQEKMEGLSVHIEDFEKQVDEEQAKIQRCDGSPSDLTVDTEDRKQQTQAYTTLREHIGKKADLECQLAMLDIKRQLLKDGVDDMASPDAGGDDAAPPPVPRGKKPDRTSASPMSPDPASFSPDPPSGLVDSDLFDQPWYHGILARVKVNQLLKDNPNVQAGDFLVRESARDPNQLVLSVYVKNRISHFKITKDEGGKYSFEGDAFATVPELVNYHLAGGVILTHKSGAVIARGVERTQRPFTHDDVQIGVKLGKGNFGDVMKGTLTRTGQECAVKTCRETVANPERFLEEADTLAQYSHPNIVTLYGVVKHDPVMILLELCLGGELLKFLRAKNDQIEVGQKVKMCLEAGLGMAYLHSKQCIHRDLAARNCLLTGGTPNTLKISDFGMSRVNADDEDIYTVQTTAKTIPIRWTAPEALVHLEYHTASDVWSYGVLMWEIFTGGKLPYAGLTNSQVKHEVLENNYRLPQPDGCPDPMHDIMTRTWQYEPKSRPTMADVCDELEGVKDTYPHDSEVC